MLLALGMPGVARAGWWQASGQHFTVYSEGNDAKLRDFAERLEKFDFLLRRVTGVTDPQQGSPVKVFLLSSDNKVKKLAHNPNVAGFYHTSERSAYAVLSRGAKQGMFDLGAEEILFHEYAHHFMLHHFPAAYPAWYVEGFAEFYSVVKFPKDGSIEFGHIPMVRAPGLVLGSPYPLKQLFARDADGLSLRDGDRYYGTAWLLTHYLRSKPERSKELTHYLVDMSNGVPDMQPDSYFQGGLDGLEKELKAYMRSRMMMFVLQPREMRISPISVSTVDAAQGAMIEPELALMGDPVEDALPDIVAAIRTVASAYPGSGYALAVLAEAEWAAQDQSAALADADRAIAADPQSSRGYAVRAQAMLEKAHDSDREEDWKAALTAIVRANRADMEDPVPLALFYRYHAMRGGKMPDLGYDGLYKAFSLLPQRPQYRFTLADAMAARGDYQLASNLLDPIAYSPHASEMREGALRLKARLDRQAEAKAAGRDPGSVSDDPAPRDAGSPVAPPR